MNLLEIPTQNLRDTEYEMSVGDLLEDIRAEPLPKFRHPFLMTGRTEMTALAGKCQEIFVAAVFAFHTGRAVTLLWGEGSGNR